MGAVENNEALNLDDTLEEELEEIHVDVPKLIRLITSLCSSSLYKATVATEPIISILWKEMDWCLNINHLKSYFYISWGHFKRCGMPILKLNINEKYDTISAACSAVVVMRFLALCTLPRDANYIIQPQHQCTACQLCQVQLLLISLLMLHSRPVFMTMRLWFRFIKNFLQLLNCLYLVYFSTCG